MHLMAPNQCWGGNRISWDRDIIKTAKHRDRGKTKAFGGGQQDETKIGYFEENTTEQMTQVFFETFNFFFKFARTNHTVCQDYVLSLMNLALQTKAVNKEYKV